MNGNNENGRTQTPKIEEANDDGKVTHCYFFGATFFWRQTFAHAKRLALLPRAKKKVTPKEKKRFFYNF